MTKNLRTSAKKKCKQLENGSPEGEGVKKKKKDVANGKHAPLMISESPNKKSRRQ